MVPVATPVIVEAPNIPAPVVTVNVPAPPARRSRPQPEGSPPIAACSWDDGFPAISADGMLLVKKSQDARPSGSMGLAIGFFDVDTSRLVRQVILLSPDRDYDAEGKLRSGIEGRVEQRVAVLQRTLDAKGFHTLIELGSSEPGVAAAEETRIHAELDGAAARIIDPARSAVLWQHSFVSNVPGRATTRAPLCATARASTASRCGGIRRPGSC